MSMRATGPMRGNVPRVLFAAPKSGGGKTTVVCGMLAALMRAGLSPAGFKCGPDYIDPMFHRMVLGTPSYNLDLFFTSEDTVRALLAENAGTADIAVLEGVMGFYDGLAGSEATASAYHLARATDTPVVFVLDARGAALSLAATVKGFQTLRPENHIAAVILNRTSEGGYRMAKPLIEGECGVPVLGYLPEDDAFSLESRHLGLVTAAEVDDLREKIDAVADALVEHVDLERLVDIAQSAPGLSYEPQAVEPVPCPDGHKPRIAVAWDKAFCFYYAENLKLLEDLGAEVVRFSPIDDDELPEGTDALYLGGGYPELHAAALAANGPMRASVRTACAADLPIFAECGGFLYLQDELADLDGTVYPMVGAIEASARCTGRLTRFGYVMLEARQDNLLCAAGDAIPAHEFHYYDSSENGDAFRAVKPGSGRSWPCFVAQGNLLAGFPHLYFPACPEAARRLVERAAFYKTMREEENR